MSSEPKPPGCFTGEAGAPPTPALGATDITETGERSGIREKREKTKGKTKRDENYSGRKNKQEQTDGRLQPRMGTGSSQVEPWASIVSARGSRGWGTKRLADTKNVRFVIVSVVAA
jgi:hypothetical protein